MADAPGVATSPRIDPDRYRDVLGRFVTGITVVTTMAEEDGGTRPFGTTVNAFNSVSLDPPLVLITVGVERSIHPVIARTGRFAVNILAEDGQDLSDCFSGAPSLHPRTAFCDATYRTSEQGMPLLDEALAWVECRLERIIEAGDHTIYLGRIVDLGVSDHERWPLLYFRRRYLRIERAASAELLGKPDAK
jgi:flavin reductase (DIM6/NTAB) family NADH-FMN oxidoreductase RutF